MGDVKDSGWEATPRTSRPPAVCESWRRTLRSSGRMLVLTASHWLDKAPQWGVCLPREALPRWPIGDDAASVEEGKRAALGAAVDWILRDEIAAGAPGDVPEWAIELTGRRFAPGAFGPFPPYHYP